MANEYKKHMYFKRNLSEYPENLPMPVFNNGVNAS